MKPGQGSREIKAGHVSRRELIYLWARAGLKVEPGAEELETGLEHGSRELSAWHGLICSPVSGSIELIPMHEQGSEELGAVEGTSTAPARTWPNRTHTYARAKLQPVFSSK